MSYDEMIAVIKAAKNGQRIERTIDGDIWKEFDPIEYGFDFNTFSYGIKPQPTREEITQKWVKDNNIVVGSKVKVVRKVENTVTLALAEKMDNTIGEVGVVKHIFSDRINIYICDDSWSYDIESLEPYKEEMIPFTFEDRDLFRGKWVRQKDGEREFMVDLISKKYAFEVTTYEEAFQHFEFIDGTPFGKLQ